MASRRLLSTCVLAACLAVVPACRSRGSSGGGSGGGGGSGRVVVRLSGYVGNPAETNLVAQLVKDFNASQTEIEVVYEPIPGQYYPKLLAMLVSKTAPDVFYLDVSWFKPFLAKQKILVKIDDLMAATGMKRDVFVPALVDAFTGPDGGMYGIPKDFNAYALFYDKDAFDRAGLAYPTPDWTLDDLEANAKKLTVDGRHGFVYMNDKVEWWLPMAESWGASVFDASGRCGLASPDAVASLDFYARLELVDHCAIHPSEVGAKYVEDAFGRRAAAMAYDGSWLIPYLQESNPEVRYGVTELPKGPKGRSNLLFTVAYAIPQTSEHPKEAWKVIEYLSSEASQAKVTFALPSRKSMSEAYVKAHPEYAAVLAGAAYAKAFDFGAKGSRVQPRLEVALQEVLIGGKPTKKALEDACAEIDRVTGM